VGIEKHAATVPVICSIFFLVTLCAGCAKQKLLPNSSMNSSESGKVHRTERRVVIGQTKKDLQEAIKNKEYSKALNITNDYLEENPDDAEAYATRGNIYYLQHRCNQAISDIDKASSMGSTSVTIAGIKALCLAENGKYEIALKSVNKRLKSRPDASLYNVRAYIYNKKGEYAKALKDCDRSIALDGSKPNPYKNKGLAYLGNSRYGEAIEQFSKAIKINPGYDLAYAGRGNAYLKMGKLEKAAIDFSKACEYGDFESCFKSK